MLSFSPRSMAGDWPTAARKLERHLWVTSSLPNVVLQLRRRRSWRAQLAGTVRGDFVSCKGMLAGREPRVIQRATVATKRPDFILVVASACAVVAARPWTAHANTSACSLTDWMFASDFSWKEPPIHRDLGLY